jgi:uncharacterized protein (DUF1330 family)
MPAYIIVHVNVIDPMLYDEYKSMTLETIQAYQGKFLARGGKTEVLEGDTKPQRVVILEFPSYELAKGWWGSDAYAGPKALRQQSAQTNMILIEGWDPTL